MPATARSSMTMTPVVPVARTGVVGRRTSTSALNGAKGLVDLGRVLLAIPFVELGRLVQGPSWLISRVRSRGHLARERSPTERQALRRLIAAVDARLPGGGNCYRRALVEMALDPSAAEERLFLGLKAHGGPRSGHAWLSSWPDTANAGAYDAVLEM